jgi:hypothetical protein
MRPVLVAGVMLVHLALACYTVGIVLEQRRRRAASAVLAFLTLGVCFDVAATACMIAGSGRVFTLHGLLGYSALLGMLAETVLVWRHRVRAGLAEVAQGLHVYSRFAYAWWLIAYVSGSLLVMMGRRSAA